MKPSDRKMLRDYANCHAKLNPERMTRSQYDGMIERAKNVATIIIAAVMVVLAVAVVGGKII